MVFFIHAGLFATISNKDYAKRGFSLFDWPIKNYLPISMFFGKSSFMSSRFVFPFITLAVLTSLCGQAQAQTSITSVNIIDLVVTDPLLRNGVSGTGGPFTVTYNGIERRIDSFIAAGDIYAPTVVGQAVARRNNAASTFPQTNPSQTAAWNAAISVSGTTHTVSGRYLNTMDALFTSRNILSGTENLFVNQSANVGDVVNNVERMDFLFSLGFQASSTTGFAVFERGRGPGSQTSGANGGFKIAAVTGIDSNGVPTAFSDAILVGEDSYNNGGVGTGLASQRYDVFRYSTATGPELDTMNNSNIGPQGVAGVFVKTTDLVSAGTTIFGYAVLGEDGPTNGGQIVNWLNTTNWLTNSGFSNDVDMVATGAVVYTLVPEPTAVSLGMLGSLLLFGKRRRKA